MAEDKKTIVERLFAHHGGALRLFLNRRVSHSPDAAEIAQEVYVRLLRVPNFDEIQNPEGYLFTVARNLAQEIARRDRRGGPRLDIEDPHIQEQLAEMSSVAGDLDDDKRTQRLRDVLRQLPIKCQAAVALHYWEGLKHEEVAQRLGVSTHMVKKYLSTALAHCRRRMARLG